MENKAHLKSSARVYVEAVERNTCDGVRLGHACHELISIIVMVACTAVEEGAQNSYPLLLANNHMTQLQFVFCRTF